MATRKQYGTHVKGVVPMYLGNHGVGADNTVMGVYRELGLRTNY